tara:strand:- start:50 stop:727 length:678 start_codon:yes stop_codon:yes gene_type:complete
MIEPSLHTLFPMRGDQEYFFYARIYELLNNKIQRGSVHQREHLFWDTPRNGKKSGSIPSSENYTLHSHLYSDVLSLLLFTVALDTSTVEQGDTMWFKIAAIVGALAVTMGAFGAHGLESIYKADNVDPLVLTEVEERLIAIWKTGTKYHLVHSIVLLVLATLSVKVTWSLRLFLTGIFIFSGTLYLMCLLYAWTGVKYGFLGAITPIGGLCLIVGWISLAFVKWR